MFKINTKYGFTFIEAIVVVAVFGFVMIIIVSSLLSFYRSNTYTLEQAFAVNSARKGIETAVRDLREAAYSDEGSYPIVSIATSSVEFYSDIDRDDSVELTWSGSHADCLTLMATEAWSSGSMP